jgi:hypothetical protein
MAVSGGTDGESINWGDGSRRQGGTDLDACRACQPVKVHTLLKSGPA